MSIRKADSLTNQAIKVRRRNLVLRIVSLDISNPKVIRQNYHDIRTIIRCIRNLQRRYHDHKNK